MEKKISVNTNPNYTAPSELKVYQGNIMSLGDFGDDQSSTSILMGAKLCNGKALAKQLFLGFRVDKAHPLYKQLIKGNEISIACDNRSKDPVRHLPPDENRGLPGGPVYALNGVNQGSLKITLSRESAGEEEYADAQDWETIKRAQGPMQRALAFFTGTKKAEIQKQAKLADLEF